MTTENKINYYFTNIYNWLNPNKVEMRNQIVQRLLFDSEFVRKEKAIERTLYQKYRRFDLSDIDQSRDFLQHVMERHGAAPFEFSKDAMLPENWIVHQLLNYLYKI